MRVFRLLSYAMAIVLAITSALHLVLLASDSETYRTWVLIQMTLLLVLSTAILLSAKGRRWALTLVTLAAIAATYINAVYLNYGNGALISVVPMGALLCYLTAAYRVSSTNDA
ncbi:hypothetical protein GCM10025772_10090 [Ferrimonas gelatinilytica]|uniref:Uncharacterized protein n=1 Tax=Ferrimonas gelatinilytica TaxID=1255257 RepID=A0ABP9RXT5_9GAMM